MFKFYLNTIFTKIYQKGFVHHLLESLNIQIRSLMLSEGFF